MAEIPAGEFLFGDTYEPRRRAGGRAPSRVYADKFYIDKCETTKRQYMAWFTAYVDTKTRYGSSTDAELDAPILNRTQAEGEA